MSEPVTTLPVTLMPGDKVKTGENTIRLTESAIVQGEIVIAAPVQKNRHMKAYCSAAECRAAQAANPKGLQFMRGSRSKFDPDSAVYPMPSCGICGAIWMWETEQTETESK